MKNMRCKVFFLFCGMFSTAVFAFDNMQFLSIGTGSTAGTYFPVGGVIANAISKPPGSRICDKGGSCGVDGLIAVSVSTNGSVDNIERLQAGEIDAALCQADVAYWTHTNKGPLSTKREKEDKEIRAISGLYREVVHLITRRDEELNTLQDLKGKRISIGMVDSGTRIHAGLIINAYNMTLGQFKIKEVSPENAADMLVNKEIDAFFYVSGTPANVIEELATRTDIYLIPLANKVMTKLIQRYPFFATTKVEKDTYGIPNDIATLSVSALLIVPETMDEELAFKITQSLHHPQNKDIYTQGHPQGKNINVSNALIGVGIPLHKGAERYYQETFDGYLTTTAKDTSLTVVPTPTLKPTFIEDIVDE